MYNLLIGGAAGQGIDTTAAILEKLFKASGYNVFSIKDFMSRVRGGHNFSLMRFGAQPVYSHSEILDGIIALDNDTVKLHKNSLKEKGFILCDTKLTAEDERMLKINMNDIAKKIGNPRVAGSISVGAVLKLFGESLQHVEKILKTSVKPDYFAMNIEAVKAGYDAVENRFRHIDGKYADNMLISGTDAVALGAAAAGVKFYSAYPMSPSTGIMESLAAKSNKAQIVVEQAEDEIAAVNMAIGASYAGVCAMTGTSGGGFSLMVEALGFSGIAEIPLVVIDVQRPGPATGLPTRTEQSDLDFVRSASQGEFPRMVIALRSAQDAFYQTMRAVDIAERYQIPVIVLSDQYLGDSLSTVELFDPKRIKPARPSSSYTGEEYLRYRYSESGVSPRLIPGKSGQAVVIADSDEHDEKGHITESAEVRTKMVDKRMKKLINLSKELAEPDFIGEKKFNVLLLGWGSLWGPIKEAVELLNKDGNLKYAALVFGDIYPLPKKVLQEKAETAEYIINIEQNATGQLAKLICEETNIVFDGSVLKYDGRQLSGEEIALRIRKGEIKND
ncbi:2-oxoacid:acceptor oxidoreductase subunit alpha [Pectinatus haikarae]|uniref:2-oxoglutarate ferredoxin oxidoreductase subunit alpha n=1 Tax=Pectinatus haikarae TaxID=349096 RepID=A0ABT9Y7L1_9FIRM|nr:2-oxoacid:acceptor oxidoreductase subunit alpha [Pectinatus haikarae]MDQ0203826.1 2-oxoglutarate ferredoxin oxidoreductase subunit alpha [Pectinatus haikarae]